MHYRNGGLRGPAAALLAALLAFCAGPALAQGAEPLRIGFICPATGGSADFGSSARLGAELAVNEINEVGGFLGRKVQIVARDDQGDPDRGRQVSEELVLKEKVGRHRWSAVMVGFLGRLPGRVRGRAQIGRDRPRRTPA